MTSKFKHITDAYWQPERGSNPPADINSGNLVVDKMSIGDLVEFFSVYKCGPTYCLVKERVVANLDKLPPRLNIVSAKEQVQSALAQLATAERQIRNLSH